VGTGVHSRRWAVRLTLALLSTVASLLLAEGLVRLRDGNAFPYLNLFVPDAQYGVKLAPSSATKVRSRGGRVTEIATNSLGFRGSEWREGGVLLLGDSQMMGYGVDWPETLAPRLERELGVPVLAAAVPSWGPMEYARAVEDLAPRFHPSTVLFVGNLANDWIEAPVPNLRRTSARDGWATSPEKTPRSSFPGREWLLGRSHLVFAARELLSLGRHAAGDSGLPANTAMRLIEDLPGLRHAPRGHHSRLGPALERTLRACENSGCEVVAVALPLDVQVSALEWRKYRAQPRELADTEVLQREFLDDARRLGLATVDLLPPLRAAEPGAFLDDDYHLSPAGHAACARAIARVLRPPTEVTRR
jgi:hypothetical protein